MTDATIPEERFQKEVERRKAAEEQRKALTEQVADLTTQIKAASKERDQFAAQVEGIGDLRAELERARSDLGSERHTSQAHVSMLEAGVSRQRIRDFVIHEHAKHQEAEGDKAKQWGDWWDANRTELLADFQPQTAAAPAPEQAATEPATESAAAPVPAHPQANNGAQPVPAPAQNYVPGSISGLSLDDWTANKAELLAGVTMPWSS